MDKKKKAFVHPYIPNSVPDVKAQMLKEIGVKDINELYEDIPANLRFKDKLDLPEPFLSEYALERHVMEILAKNKTCQEYLNFLGGDTWQHYVPAICDEINSRSEFLTAYAGEPYEDHGRFQALFEYASMMGELLDMDVVNVPTYDWGQAASTSLRMAGRITGRQEVLVAKNISPDRFLIIKNYCEPVVSVKLVEYDPKTGMLDLEDLKSKISSKTAAVYIENPSHHGIIETQGEKITEITHKNGAISIVGADPISLGVLTPPSQYGADIVCGDIQSLGMHMQFGGGLAGYIATRDEVKYVMEYPSRLFGITSTIVDGEHGFGDVMYDRTSFHDRVEGKEFIGTCSALWGITAGVYLALVGPQGMQELGQLILQKSQYAMKKISEIKGVKIPFQTSPHFKEFIVDFSSTGKTVKEVNKALLKKGIFGGKDVSSEFPELGNCAVYCITEIHTMEDINQLVQALKECLS
ncbi:MAG TPA: aminomethyl-transferring glycine dehydrogenase subunit GcvPA [candidate division Zixibacteria bacterium]|nr:aminomethyl-transferring glycine dehydrogenase subunit GcvPA [candidate division Zixibacteria bacterium]